jgi:hypothetical protein
MTRLLGRGWIVLAVLAACGGGSGPGTGDAAPGVDLPGADVEDAVGPGDEAPRDTAPTGPRYKLVLLHDTSQPVEVVLPDTLTIKVQVLDLHNGGVEVPEQPVDFAIVKTTDLADVEATGDAFLEYGQNSTDGNGVAHDPFHSGNEKDRIYFVEASTEDADAVTLRIRVVDSIFCGCANVELAYAGTLPTSALSKVKVYALDPAYPCEELHAEKPVPPSVSDKTLTGVTESVTFDCLKEIPGAKSYSIYVTAKGPNGCVVATGCAPFDPQPDNCVKVTVEVDEERLNPTGMYDCIDHFDLTNLVKECAGGIKDPLECFSVGGADLGKQVCCVVYQLVTFFNSPGTTIIAAIKDVAKQFIGSIIVDTLFSVFEDVLADIVTDWLLENSPEWVKDFFAKGKEMMEIVTALELRSDLLIGKTSGDVVTGVHNWTGITIGGKTFSLNDLQNTKFPLSLVQGTWTGEMYGFYNLRENPHAIHLNYGKLILFVLDEILIAGVTGGQAHSLEEAAYLWIDCKGIAKGIYDALPPGVFSGSVQDLEQICIDGIDYLLSPVEMFIGALQLDTYLTLEGEGRMVDDDCDLKVDKIVDGTYDGIVQTPTSTQGTFTGTWEATKK